MQNLIEAAADPGSPDPQISGPIQTAAGVAANVPGAGAPTNDLSGGVPAATRLLIQQNAVARRARGSGSRQIVW